MNELTVPLVIGGIVVLIIGIAVAAWRIEQKRIEALRQVATKLGLEFTRAKDHALARQFRFLNQLRSGENRYAFHVLTGTLEGETVLTFDYHYETTSTDSKGHRSTSHHHLHVHTVQLRREVPETLIAPEGLFSKLAQAFGYDDIDFESAEFSRKFCVRSKDKRFAYDLCDARMIEFLLAHPRLQIEAEGTTLAAIHSGKMKPTDLESKLRDLLEIRRRIPTHLAV